MLYVEHVISMFSKWLNFILADFDKNSEAEVSAAYGTGRLILIRLEYYMISYLLRARRQNGSNAFWNFVKTYSATPKRKPLMRPYQKRRLTLDYYYTYVTDNFSKRNSPLAMERRDCLRCLLPLSKM
jgi:hypothetical protein